MKKIFIALMMLAPFSAQASSIMEIVQGNCFHPQLTSITEVVTVFSSMIVLALITKLVITIIEKNKNKNLPKE